MKHECCLLCNDLACHIHGDDNATCEKTRIEDSKKNFNARNTIVKVYESEADYLRGEIDG